MRILIATSAFAPTLGGVQTVTEALARGLEAQGHQVRVLAQRVPLRLARRETRQGLRVERIWFPEPQPPAKNVKAVLLYLYALLMRPLSQTRLHRLLKDFQPDLINLHHPQTMVSYFQSALSRNPLPVITSLHGYDLECFVPEEARTLKAVQFKVVTAAFIRVQQWLQSSTAVVANSQYTATLAQKMNPQAPAPHVIYNALDPARFKGVAKRPDKAPSRYLFAFGRLDKQKGFDLLLEAYAQLANAQSLQLIIAGSGPDQAQYEQYIAEAGLQEKVYLPGRATPKEVVAYLQHADLVVVPSRWEAFGITVLEALAAGKKVVATDVGGIPEFANFPHCHICAPTAAALAQAIPKALAQEMKPTQKEAQQKEIWSKFNEEVYLQKFSAVIEKVVS